MDIHSLHADILLARPTVWEEGLHEEPIDYLHGRLGHTMQLKNDNRTPLLDHKNLVILTGWLKKNDYKLKGS